MFALAWPLAVLASFLWNMWVTQVLTLAIAHGLLWLIGLGMIIWGDRRLRRSERELEGSGGRLLDSDDAL